MVDRIGFYRARLEEAEFLLSEILILNTIWGKCICGTFLSRHQEKLIEEFLKKIKAPIEPNKYEE